MLKENSVLLVGAPYLDNYGGEVPGASYYFPLGLGYLASYLQKHGYTVDLLCEDGVTDVMGEVRSRLSSREYLCVGVSCMTSSYAGGLRIAGLAKQLAPSTPVILGGAHISAVGGSILDEQPEVDMLCTGEGEIALLELVTALRDGVSDLSPVRGLLWRDPAGVVHDNGPAPLHENLDDFPFPARDLVEFDRFALHSHVSSGHRRAATIVTSRGCPFNCIFCSAHLTHGRKYRFHSDDYVIDEIRLLRDRYGVAHVFIEDDSFTVVRERVRRLCERFRRELPGMTFGCFSRVDIFDEEMAAMLHGAGVRLVVFGIESGVPEVLKKMRKGADVSGARRAIALCRQYGMESFASFVVGFPFETRRDIEQTIAFGGRLDATSVTFNPLVPYPGTPLFDPERHRPASPEGWERFLTSGTPPFDTCPEVNAAELKRMVDRAHLRFYLHPRRMLGLLRAQRSWRDFRSLAGAGLRLIKRQVGKG